MNKKDAKYKVECLKLLLYVFKEMRDSGLSKKEINKLSEKTLTMVE